MLGWFMTHLAEIDSVDYPQDLAGGEEPTPRPESVQVPCCVQQDKAPERLPADQDYRGSTARVTVFFTPGNPASAAAVAALKVDSQVIVTGGSLPFPLALIATGPAYDESGRGAVWAVQCLDNR